MKSILVIAVVLILSSCGPHLYKTMSGGQENVSYIIVLQKGNSLGEVSLFIDDKVTPVDKVFKEKNKRKAHPVVTSPGKHKISVVSQKKVIYEENVFLGLQETKKIVLE